MSLDLEALSRRAGRREALRAVVETPGGSRNKFTYDEDLGLFRLHKILPLGSAFPFDFGFIPGTLADGRAFLVEAILLAAAALVATRLTEETAALTSEACAAILLTAIAMGLRSAIVRSLGVADMTTTVLTMTITGLAADSSLAGGANPRWPRRLASVLAMATGAALGAWLMRRSVALPLALAALAAGGVALSAHLQSRAIPATR